MAMFERARRAVAATAAACAIALTFAPRVPAEPTGIFRVFAQCPTKTPGDAQCIAGEVAGGEMSIGSVRVPIDRGLLLRAGDLPVGSSEAEYSLLPPENGETISKAELEIPGGLQRFANVNCASLGTSCGLTASIELLISQRDHAIINEFDLNEGVAAGLILPVRIHLHNPFLGYGCYIGSEPAPLHLRLTDGETHPPAGFKPMRGKEGKTSTLEENGQSALRVSGVSLVDNTFTAPGAEGCGSFRSAIDNGLKIPNRAGENVAILDATLFVATPQAVLASEQW
jgi:hypothetical protein